MKFLILAVVVILFNMDLPAVKAQNTNETLRGAVVVAETADPIVGATVKIQELTIGMATNLEGEFQFPDISPGNYTLSVQSVGYLTKEVNVTHPDDGYMMIEMHVSVYRIDEVIVTSSPLGRDIRYQPAQALNRRNLQERTAPSLGEMLEANPGVAMRSFGSAPARPVIRGMDGERVLVLQNGERTGDFSSTSSDHTVALDPLEIERVEIVRGPASLLYGSSALGGVVNMFTLDLPQDWETGMSGSVTGHGASVNLLGAGMVRGQYGTENWALSGSAIFREGGNIRTPESELPSTWINSYSFGSGFGYRTGNLQTSVAVKVMNNDYGIPDKLDDPGESPEIRSKRYSLQSVSLLELDNGFFENAELRLHANYNVLDDIEVEIEPVGEVEESLEKRLEQRSVTSTFTLRHRPLSVFEGVIGMNMQFRDLKISGEEILAPNTQNVSLAAFIYEEMSLSENVSLQAGSRLEFQQMNLRENELFGIDAVAAIDDKSDLIFSGSTGVNVRPAARWEAGIQLARAFRTPSLEELYSDAPHYHVGAYEIGDPGLDNEVSLGMDLFVNYRDSKFNVQLSGYVNRIDHFIMYTPTGQIHEPSGLPVFTYSATDALLFGFEFILEGKIADHLVGGVSLDYVNGSQRDVNRTPLSFMPPLRTKFSFRYDNNIWWAGFRLRLVDGQDRVAPLENSTDGYSLLGVDGGYCLGEGITLSLRADNLLNVSYRDHLTRIEDRNNPMPGRNLNATLRWDF